MWAAIGDLWPSKDARTQEVGGSILQPPMTPSRIQQALRIVVVLPTRSSFGTPALISVAGRDMLDNGQPSRECIAGDQETRSKQQHRSISLNSLGRKRHSQVTLFVAGSMPRRKQETCPFREDKRSRTGSFEEVRSPRSLFIRQLALAILHKNRNIV